MSKLKLHKETLQSLDGNAAERVAGGTSVVEVVSEYPISVDICVHTTYITPTGWHWTMEPRLCNGPMCAVPNTQV